MNESPNRVRWLPASFGLYALLGGAISFMGWTTGLRRLTDWFDTGISIQPNSTVALMAAGAGLLLLSARRRRLTAVMGLVAALIGGAIVFEHVTGIDLGIDSLLLFDRAFGGTRTVVPGRVGPPGALSYVLLGAALVLTRGGPKARQTSAVLALVATGIGMLALVGYFFGADLLYGVPQLTAIAFQTCTMILALAVGLVVALRDRQPTRVLLEDSAAGALARRALPFVILLPIVVGWIRMRGQDMGLFDTGTGTSLLVISLVVLLCAVLWWGVTAVAEREAAIVALNESRVRADMVLGAARDQFIVLDRDWRYTYLNDRVVDVTQMPRERVLGRTLWELWPAVIGTPLEPALRRVMERREAESLDYYLAPWDRWFDARIHPTTEGGVALFVLEITDRKRAEAALLESEQRLKEADRKKDEFLATMAHELRNPLAPIRNAVAILGAKGPRDRELDWARNVIDRQVGQMAHLLDDLLDVARITQNRLELRKQRLTVEEIVGRSVETSRPLIEAAAHQLVVSLPPGDVWVEADPMRISQVVSNLLNNAAKYTPRGGRITLRVEREGSDVVLAVEDDGIGISPEQLDHVFEMFSQAAPALERAQGGLGIGLSIVRGIVEAHGGHVEARSDGLNRGSRFLVRLPVASLIATDGTAVANEPAAPRPAPLKIVVADDNPDSVESLAMVLGFEGHEIHVAHDGVEAVELASRVRPDVMLLDIGMPRLNGYEVARRVREQPWARNAVLVALTGWGQQEDRERGAEAGFDHHLVKPLELRKLIALLSRSGSREPVG